MVPVRRWVPRRTARVIAILQLESIADDMVMRGGRLIASGDSVPMHMRRAAKYIAASPVWVARVVGRRREFLRAKRDYRDADATGARGIMLVYELRDGVYEVNARTSWCTNRRYFVRSSEGRVVEIDRSEVAA